MAASGSGNGVLERVKILEVAGVFRRRDVLDAAADALLLSGFDRADLDMVAGDDARERLAFTSPLKSYPMTGRSAAAADRARGPCPGPGPRPWDSNLYRCGGSSSGGHLFGRKSVMYRRCRGRRRWGRRRRRPLDCTCARPQARP
jgi:hypothetical protein